MTGKGLSAAGLRIAMKAPLWASTPCMRVPSLDWKNSPQSSMVGRTPRKPSHKETKADSGTTDNLTQTARDIGQQVGSRAAEEWQQRKQQVSEAAGNLKDSAARSAGQVRDTANRATYRVRQQSRQGIDAAQTMITDHPMATALVALGVGLLLGSMLGGQGRKSRAYDYRDQELDLGEYGSSRSYRSRDRESDYRRAETNAGYDRSGY